MSQCDNVIVSSGIRTREREKEGAENQQIIIINEQQNDMFISPPHTRTVFLSVTPDVSCLRVSVGV